MGPRAVLCALAAVVVALAGGAEAKVARATFREMGADGIIELKQAAPGSPTTVTVAFNALPPLASGYHVHVLPVPVATSSAGTAGLCGATSGHYDPHGTGGCTSGLANETCEVGGLSGRHGPIAAQKAYSDPNLPLFGTTSVVGRSIVVHSSVAGSPRIACATIFEVVASGATLAPVPPSYVARFYGAGGVAGLVTFTAAAVGTDTSISVDLVKTDANASAMHQWHVHVDPVTLAAGGAAFDCGTAGGHFNPTGRCLPGAACQCAQASPTECEVGDLFGKHGGLAFAAGPASAGGLALRAQLTDVQLPLSGPMSIAGRSIVIHEAGLLGGRIACAMIEAVVPRNAVARFQTRGDVLLSQPFPGFPTTVTVRASGAFFGPLVYSRPLLTEDHMCDGGGDLFDPYGTQGSCSGTLDALDCPVGAISGKHDQAQGATYLDPNLPLFGVDSVVGRAMLLFSPDGSLRIDCGNIALNRNSEARTLFAHFDGPDVLGEISLEQDLTDPLADTLVHVGLSYIQSTPTTTGHQWHVHVTAVDETVGCGSAGGHYNPMAVCLDGAACDYAARCGAGPGQRSCEIGDLASKHGRLSIAFQREPVAYNDLYLPLSTSVPGAVRARQSIVVHNPQGDGGRFLCATLFERQTVIQPPEPAPAGSKGGLSGGAVAGIVITVLLVVALAGFAAFFAHSRRGGGGGANVFARFSNSSLDEELVMDDDRDFAVAMSAPDGLGLDPIDDGFAAGAGAVEGEEPSFTTSAPIAGLPAPTADEASHC